MESDVWIELAKNYEGWEEIDEKKYEPNFSYINETSIGKTIVIEEDPNSEHMPNVFECNDNNNNNNNNNNNTFYKFVENAEKATVIYEEKKNYFDLHKETQKDDIIRYNE